MIKKKTLAVLCAILAVSISLAMPVSAQERQPTATQSNMVIYSNGMIQPFWNIAETAILDFKVSSGTAKATIIYSKPAAASASMSVIIYAKAPGSSNWVKAASSSSASASCPTKTGYEYKAEATLTLTMNGNTEVIYLSA